MNGSQETPVEQIVFDGSTKAHGDVERAGRAVIQELVTEVCQMIEQPLNGPVRKEIQRAMEKLWAVATRYHAMASNPKSPR